jgi:hypothetical protein
MLPLQVKFGCQFMKIFEDFLWFLPGTFAVFKTSKVHVTCFFPLVPAVRQPCLVSCLLSLISLKSFPDKQIIPGPFLSEGHIKPCIDIFFRKK